MKPERATGWPLLLAWGAGLIGGLWVWLTVISFVR